MSLSIPTQIAVPFATSGLKDTIPANSDNVTGRAGYDQGFPPVNMTPKVAGGIPPFGEDMNGILFDVTRAVQFLESGTGFIYKSTFSTAIGGYNAGARVLRTDGRGYWLNTTNGNTTDPESAGGAAAGWVPDYTNGVAAITMTNANVTLTALQYGRPIIVITGALTANLNLIFPAIAGQWVILNSTTGAFTITCKTAAGSGIVSTGATSIFCDGTNIYSSFSQILPVATTVIQGITRFATAAEAAAGSLTTVAVTPSGLTASELGRAQTYQNVTASRAFATTYTNATDKPILVNVYAVNGGAGSNLSVSISGAAAFVFAASQIPSGTSICVGNFIVQPGLTYAVTQSGGVTLSSWYEMRT